MTPQELSQEIRRIAARIEASNNPSRKLVAQDIQRIISRLANAETMMNVAEEECGPTGSGPKIKHEDSKAGPAISKIEGQCKLTVNGKTFTGATAEECMEKYQAACANGEC